MSQRRPGYGVEAAQPDHRLFHQFGDVRLAGDIGGDKETFGASKSKLVCKRPLGLQPLYFRDPELARRARLAAEPAQTKKTPTLAKASV